MLSVTNHIPIFRILDSDSDGSSHNHKECVVTTRFSRTIHCNLRQESAVHTASNANIQSGSLHRHYQLGAINRATRQLICAQGHNDLLNIIQKLCISLELSGFAHLKGQEKQFVCKIASGVPRTQIHTLASVLVRQEKIIVEQSLFAFNYSGITLIVHHQAHDTSCADLIQDDLALFLDSADIWLSNLNARLQTQNLIEDQLCDFQRTLLEDQIRLGSKRDLIVNKMLTDITTIFPTLGLEPDQEDQIYDAIDPIIRAMSHALENQADTNSDLSTLVERLLQHLQGAPSEFDSDEDIVLF